MCFSAQADLVTGLAVGAVGVDALRHVSKPRELPLASLPMLFAAHQLIETFVWWGLDGQVPWSVARIAMWIYLVIAFVLPVVIPLCVLAVEPNPRRREVMALSVGLGVGVTAVLLVGLVQGPVGAHDAGHRIAYQIGGSPGVVLEVLYVIATCGALLASSSRAIAFFGVANLFAVTVLAVLTTGNIASLWCGWAAISSVAIAFHLRHLHGRAQLARANAA
ncbi:MAG: DUF6629 family protein [Acidimicrobiia bacterium]